ncbi:MAG: hypothetical protein AB7L09_00400 [Nitrospira sp.]
MDSRRFATYRFIKRAPACGWSRIHIFDVTEKDTKSALCGVVATDWVGTRLGRSIEAVLGRIHNMPPHRSKLPCKRCLGSVQKFRSPLDRMSEIDTTDGDS